MAKFVSDVLVIAELQLLRSSRPLWSFLLNTILFPLPMLFFARYLLGEVGELGPRWSPARSCSVLGSTT